MKETQVCCYCEKEIKGKSFIPVRSENCYHWKCYVQKVKTEKFDSEYAEEKITEKVIIA